MRMPVNYIWCGQPPQSEHGGIVGHDLIGPLQMNKAVDHTKTELIFWCLDEYVVHYTTKFQGTQITVKSVDAYLAQKAAEENATNDSFHPANTILSLKAKILSSEEDRGKIRDYVTLKNMFAYLLLCDGGYTLDTNVMPETSIEQVEFPAYPKFMMPSIATEVKTLPNIDIWMLFAPKSNAHAKNVLGLYLNQLDEIEKKIFSMQGYSDKFFNGLSGADIGACWMIPSANKFSTYPDRLQPVLEFWGTRVSDNQCVLLQEPRVRKTYYNTHKREHLIDLTLGKKHNRYQLHAEAAHGELETLAFLIEQGEDVNQEIVFSGTRTCTPLHAALMNRQEAAAILLLLLGANEKAILTKNQNGGIETYDAKSLAEQFFLPSSVIVAILSALNTPDVTLSQKQEILRKNVTLFTTSGGQALARISTKMKAQESTPASDSQDRNNATEKKRGNT